MTDEERQAIAKKMSRDIEELEPLEEIQEDLFECIDKEKFMHTFENAPSLSEIYEKMDAEKNK